MTVETVVTSEMVVKVERVKTFVTTEKGSCDGCDRLRQL